VAPTIISVPVKVSNSPSQAALCSCFSTKEKPQMEKHEKRARGSGSIFQNGSSTWWIKFSDRGIARRESSHSTDYADAEKLLKKRLAETLTQTYAPSVNVKIDKLIEDVFIDYRNQGRKSIEDVKRRWRLHLMPWFRNRKASDLTTDCINSYIEKRKAESINDVSPEKQEKALKACAATINRELALLKYAYNLGRKCTPPKVRVVPYFPSLEESKPRGGFLESAGYAALAKECARVGLWLRTMFELGYTYGWRVSEVVGLRVRQVDLMEGMVRLEDSKNGEPREAAMTQSIRVFLTECVRGKQPADHVFTREGGQPVRNFRKRWANVCVAAGVGEFLCPLCEDAVNAEMHCAGCKKDWTRNKVKYSGKDGGLIFHDLRRTGVMNMSRAGISDKVGMTISGHLTRSIYDRYRIVPPKDLRDAARALEASQRDALEKSQAPEFGQTLGRVAPKTENANEAPAPAPLPN
jgi:integrase